MLNLVKVHLKKLASLALSLLVTATFLGLVTQLQAAPAIKSPLRWAYYGNTASSLESLRANADSLHYLAPSYFYLLADGSVAGGDQPEVTRLTKSKGVKILPMLQNDQYNNTKNALHNLLADPAKVRKIIDAIDSQITAYGYDGYHIDFEDVLASDRALLTNFMAELYARLHPKNKLVTMAVVARTRESTGVWSGAYDYAALAPYLDYVVMMAYDYSYPGGADGPVAPVNWVTGVAAYAASQFSPGKVLMGVNWYGHDWNLTTGGRGRSGSYNEVIKWVQNNRGAVGYDENVQEAYADYVEDGNRRRTWFPTPRSFQSRLDVIKKNNLAGFAAWSLGFEGPDFWKVINRWQ